MFRTTFSADNNVTVSAHNICDNYGNNTKNNGITKETFVTYSWKHDYQCMPGNWTCSGASTVTLDQILKSVSEDALH